MTQDPKPKALDGQKKFTATLTGFFMSFLNALVTTGVMTEEAASPLIQIIAIGLPIVGAFAYDVIQGSHDKKKLEIEKVEIEKRYLLPEKPEAPAPPPPKRTRVNFKAFLADVMARTKTDEESRPEATSLYYSLIDEGQHVEVEVLADVWEYGNLVVDAAERKFEELNGFNLRDPNLAEVLRTRGKCPYSNVDAFCAYEGNRTALYDVKNAQNSLNSVRDLITLDTTASWRGYYDPSLKGLLWGAEHLLAVLQQQGR